MKPPVRLAFPAVILPAVVLLTGCQSAPGPAPAVTGDFPEVQQILARLGPDPRAVSVVANGSESWEQVDGRLRQACREHYPALGPAPVITVVDRREVTREVDLPAPGFGAHSPGGAGMNLLATPMPSAALKPRLTLKKALAGCAAPA